MNCVLAQRLIRVICKNCAEPLKYTVDELVESRLDPALSELEFQTGTGCIDCHGTGYRGRESITELLDLTDTIRELILAREPSSRIRHAAEEAGMTDLRHSAVLKMIAGRTTLHEINKVTFIE